MINAATVTGVTMRWDGDRPAAHIPQSFMNRTAMETMMFMNEMMEDSIIESLRDGGGWMIDLTTAGKDGEITFDDGDRGTLTFEWRIAYRKPELHLTGLVVTEPAPPREKPSGELLPMVECDAARQLFEQLIERIDRQGDYINSLLETVTMPEASESERDDSGRLDDEQVIRARQEIADGKARAAVRKKYAAQCGVAEKTIDCALTGRTHFNLPFPDHYPIRKFRGAMDYNVYHGKFTPDAVYQARLDMADGAMTKKEVMEKHAGIIGCCPGNVGAVLTGKTWKNVAFPEHYPIEIITDRKLREAVVRAASRSDGRGPGGDLFL